MATVERDFDCPAGDVLRLLADGWSFSSWVVGTSRIRAVDSRWPAPGARLAHSVGVWPALIHDVTVCLGWDGERGIELQARGWPLGEARVRIEVRAVGEGRCRVRLTEDAVKGPGTALPKPVRIGLLVPRNRETLRRLRMLAERRTNAGSDGNE